LDIWRCMIEYIKDWWSIVTGLVVTVFLAGIYIQREKENRTTLTNHARRISAVEVGKVDNASCAVIQSHFSEKFSEGTSGFAEVKQLIKDSNVQNQLLIEQANQQHERRYNNLIDLVKVMVDKS